MRIKEELDTSAAFYYCNVISLVSIVDLFYIPSSSVCGQWIRVKSVRRTCFTDAYIWVWSNITLLIDIQQLLMSKVVMWLVGSWIHIHYYDTTKESRCREVFQKTFLCHSRWMDYDSARISALKTIISLDSHTPDGTRIVEPYSGHRLLQVSRSHPPES